jgi:hypothetical protein
MQKAKTANKKNQNNKKKLNFFIDFYIETKLIFIKTRVFINFLISISFIILIFEKKKKRNKYNSFDYTN